MHLYFSALENTGSSIGWLDFFQIRLQVRYMVQNWSLYTIESLMWKSLVTLIINHQTLPLKQIVWKFLKMSQFRDQNFYTSNCKSRKRSWNLCLISQTFLVFSRSYFFFLLKKKKNRQFFFLLKKNQEIN